MAGRSAASRRLPENDSTIAYVQADGLVSSLILIFFPNITKLSDCRVTHVVVQ